MSRIQGFEDLKVWQKARELNQTIYQLSNKGAFDKDLGLKNQIRKAAISISSNIAEGFERNGNKEFCQFLFIAKGSAGEVRSQLYLAKDLEYINDDEFSLTLNHILDISKMINGLIRYLKTTKLKGTKFMEEEPEYGSVSFGL
jgi:four helix bundle protein